MNHLIISLLLFSSFSFLGAAPSAAPQTPVQKNDSPLPKAEVVVVEEQQAVEEEKTAPKQEPTPEQKPTEKAVEPSKKEEPKKAEPAQIDHSNLPPEDRPGAPRIPTIADLTATDPDPDNKAGFAKAVGEIMPATAPPAAADHGSYTPRTDEERAAHLQQQEQHKKAALDAALKQEKIKSKAVKKEKDLFELNLKGLREAGVDVTKSGVACSGRINIWNGAYARMTFAATTAGILAQAYMTELKLGPMKISGVGPDGKYGTKDDGVIVEIKINNKKQRVMISGMIDLLAVLTRADLVAGNDGFTLFTSFNLLNAYRTKILAESKNKDGDMDFIYKCAVNADFLRFIETLAIDSMNKLSKFTSDGIKKLEGQVKKAKESIEDMKKAHKAMRKSYKQAERRYKRKTRHGEKAIAPLRKSVERLEKAFSKIKDQIWKIRRQLVAGRRKTLSGIRKAQRKVNSLKGEVNKAKREFRKAKRRAKWYKPWTYAVVAWWAVRLAAVEVSRWSAEKVLQGLMAIINIFPIDSIPPLPVLWTSYGSTYVAMKSAHRSLSLAMLATNPLAAKELGEMIGLGIAMAGNQAAILSLRSGLITLQASLSAARRAVDAAGKMTEIALKAAVAVAGMAEPVKFTGCSISFSYKELIAGKLPEMGIMGRIFGIRKNIVMKIDVTKPETFPMAFAKAFVGVMNPGYTGPNVFDEIESVRLEYKDELDRIEREQKENKEKEASWKKREAERNTEIERLNNQNKQREDAAEKLNNMQKGGSEFGQALDVNKEIEETFDPNNPTRYTAKNRQNNFRWFDKWQLPKKNSGTVVFKAQAGAQIQVGFNNKADADEKTKLFDVVIGCDENSGTMIRDSKDNVLIRSNDQDARISNTKVNDPAPLAYWISYDNGYIACGKGSTPGDQLMVEWQIKNPPADVEFFSFSSHNNRVAYEEIGTAPAFSRPFGTQYSVYGGVNRFSWPNAFTLPTADAGTILFKAKAERDIVIGLTNKTDKDYARYLVSLGMDGNSMSSLAKVSDDGKNYDRTSISKDKDVLVGDGRNYQQYWLTYNKGHLAIGRGDDPTDNVLLEYLDRDPVTDIKNFSFSSWDNAVEIRDIAAQEAAPIKVGSRYSAVNRAYTFMWRDEWKLNEPSKGLLTWEGKGSNDMVIGLHTGMPKDDKTCTYKLIIGANNNRVTKLLDASGTVLAQTSDTKALIRERNNYNPYWLLYDKERKALVLGAGSKPGKNTVLEYLEATQNITHFSLSNNKGFIEYQRIESVPAVAVQTGTQFSALNKRGAFTWRSEWQLPTPGKGVVVFDAKAHYDVTIGLHTTDQEAGDRYTYKIVIGNKGNSRTMLFDKNNKEMTNEPARIPDAQNFYPYWVAYDQAESTVSWGRGAQPGTAVLGQRPLAHSEPITHFSFSNNKEPAMYKNIAAYQHDDPALAERAKKVAASFITDARGGIQYPWREQWQLSQKDSGAILFSAKARNNICLGFATEGKKGTRPTYELIIGHRNNTETIIRDNRGRVQAISKDKDALIKSDGDYYDYWAHYHKGHISVGRGTKVGQKIILEWFDPQRVKGITYFALTNAKTPVEFDSIKRGHVGPQQIYRTYSAWRRRGQFAWIPQWRLSKPEKGMLLFNAKADEEIMIGLGRATREAPSYVITIGADKNKTSVVTKTRPIRTIKGDNAKITNPHGYNPYWLVYDRGYISFGHGSEPGQQMIDEWHDPVLLHVVDSFSLSSNNNQVSYRDIRSEPVVKKAFKRHKTYAATALNKVYFYKPEWRLPQKDKGSITFTAQGKENIRIALFNELTTASNLFSYEVVIGANKNTEMIIRDRNGTIKARTQNPQATIIFPDQANEYWVSYKNGRISVGAGDDPANNQLLSYKDRNAPTGVEYFSFSSNKKDKILYRKITTHEYAKADARVAYTAHQRKGKYKVKSTWSTGRTRSTTVLVEARAKQEVMLALCSDMSETPQYDVVVGAENNTATILRKNGVEVARATGEDAIIGNELVDYTYWLSVHNGVVSMGRGKEPGKEQLLVWQDDEQPEISYYGLGSNENTITYKDMRVKPGVTIARNTFYTARQTKGAFTWNSAWRIQPDHSILFTADMPHADIYLGLRSIATGPALYSIRLGGWKNTKCAILKGDKVVAEIDKTMKLGKKKVWLSATYNEKTQSNRIIIGTGEPGVKTLLDWTDDKPNGELRYLGLGSGNSTVAYRKIRYASELVMPIVIDESPEETIAEAAQAVAAAAS